MSRATAFVIRWPVAASTTMTFFFSGSRSRRRHGIVARTAAGFVITGAAAFVRAGFFGKSGPGGAGASTLTTAR